MSQLHKLSIINRDIDNKSTIGTVWLNSINEWRPIPSVGLPLSTLPLVIVLGTLDLNGVEIMPGAYKVIEYRPLDEN